MTSIPTTMRAILHNQTIQTLSFASSHPVPRPKDNEYLLKVSASAITTGELLWPRPEELAQDYIPAVEMAGTVAIAPSGGKFHVGDKVYMRTTFPRSGSAAEYTIGLEDELALRPSNISCVEAAAVPVGALTAWQGLYVHAGIEQPSAKPHTSEEHQGLRILINGASSAVGLWLCQLARLHRDIAIVGICSTKNTRKVYDAGADEVIDYTNTPLRNVFQTNGYAKFDHVFDCAGLHKTPDLWTAVKAGGKLWTIVPPVDMQWKFDLPVPQGEEGVEEGISGRFFVMEAKGHDLEKITGLVEEGKVRGTVDSVWALEDFEGAFERVGSGRVVGKVVFRVSEEEVDELNGN